MGFRLRVRNPFKYFNYEKVEIVDGMNVRTIEFTGVNGTYIDIYLTDVPISEID